MASLPLQSDGLLICVLGAGARVEQKVTWDGHVVVAGLHHSAEGVDENTEAEGGKGRPKYASVLCSKHNEDNAEGHQQHPCTHQCSVGQRPMALLL